MRFSRFLKFKKEQFSRKLFTEKRYLKIYGDQSPLVPIRSDGPAVIVHSTVLQSVDNSGMPNLGLTVTNHYIFGRPLRKNERKNLPQYLLLFTLVSISGLLSSLLERAPISQYDQNCFEVALPFLLIPTVKLQTVSHLVQQNPKRFTDCL